jgi:hypothetical protein
MPPKFTFGRRNQHKPPPRAFGDNFGREESKGDAGLALYLQYKGCP